VVSGELDGRERRCGSPAAAGGVGRSRERVKLCEMRRGVCVGHWRGSKKGARHVDGRCGREIQRRARVRTRRSTASVEGAKLTGQAHDAEREERGARSNSSATGDPGPRDRERERAGEENWRRQIGPTGQRAREGARTRGRTVACETVRARGLAGPTWAGWAALSFSFSLDFPIPFPFFSIELSNPNSN
jgi:hypothetical protein